MFFTRTGDVELHKPPLKLKQRYMMNVLIISKSNEVSILFSSKFRELDIDVKCMTLCCLMEAKIYCESQTFDYIIFDTLTYPVPPISDLVGLGRFIPNPLLVYAEEFIPNHINYLNKSYKFCYLTQHCVYLGFSHILHMVKLGINFTPPEICKRLNTHITAPNKLINT